MTVIVLAMCIGSDPVRPRTEWWVGDRNQERLHGRRI